MEAWKIIILSKWVICRFYVNLPGVKYTPGRLTAGSPTAMGPMIWFQENDRSTKPPGTDMFQPLRVYFFKDLRVTDFGGQVAKHAVSLVPQRNSWLESVLPYVFDVDVYIINYIISWNGVWNTRY